MISSKKERAQRNRTITIDGDETEYYFTECLNGFDFPEKIAFSDISDKIIFGDTFSILEKFPDSFVDLLVADPPYNLSKKYGDTDFKKMKECEYRSFTQNWVSKVRRLLKKTASIYVCCDWKSSLIIGDILSEHFYVQNRITWQREKGRGTEHNWKNSMEDIWFATVSPDKYTFNAGDVKMRRKVIAPYKSDGKPKDWTESENGKFRDTFSSNFWDDISVPYWSMPENTDHPTQKPEKLAAKIILASSNAEDMVFDPFLGSGTTAVVAKKLGRKYSGIEFEKEYCAIAQKRLHHAKNNKDIQGYTDGVFWERNTSVFQRNLKNEI